MVTVEFEKERFYDMSVNKLIDYIVLLEQMVENREIEIEKLVKRAITAEEKLKTYEKKNKL